MNPISLRKIARSYGVSAPAIAGFMERHGLTREQVADPDALFTALLATGKAGALRKRLSDPAKRREISAKLI